MIFTKTYDLSLHRDYVSHWGMIEAVRELIQNALDSNSPFVYEFDHEDDGKFTLILNSEHTVLQPATLLLGSTTKRDDQDAIGSFGEGYKIALLVLLRAGYPVAMRNGDLNWTPVFRHDSKFGVEHLAIEETKRTDKINRGLTFMVSNLTEQDVEQIKASCLRMQEHIGAIKQTEFGDILLEKPKSLYVGGLYICETELQYGYNIMPKHIKLERDRRTVDSYDLRQMTLRMWYATKEFDRIAKMINEGVPDMDYARYDAPEMVREACYQLFRENHPGSIIAESPQELKRMVEQGMQKTVYINSGMHYAVSHSRSYRNQATVKLKTPAERMQEFYEEHNYRMHHSAKLAFKALQEESKGWQLK
jgi:hypothetical protein